jgi:hypothetical protein
MTCAPLIDADIVSYSPVAFDAMVHLSSLYSHALHVIHPSLHSLACT